MTRNEAADRLRASFEPHEALWIKEQLDDALATERHNAMMKILDELEVGFANNPKHHEAVVYRVREAVRTNRPLPTETFAAAVRRGAA